MTAVAAGDPGSPKNLPVTWKIPLDLPVLKSVKCEDWKPYQFTSDNLLKA